MRKLLAIILSVLMLFSMVAVSIIASASAPVGTTYEYSFNKDKGGLTLSESTMPAGKPNYTANGGYYYQFTGVEAGQTAVFTSTKQIEPGKYKVNFYTRTNNSGRALIDVTLNDYPAVEIDANTAYVVYKEYLLYESVDIYGDFTVRLDAKSAGSIYAGYVAFEKIGEYEGEEITTVPTEPPTTTTTTSTPIVDEDSFKWNLYTDNFTYNADHTMNNSSNGKPFLNTHYANEGTYFFSSNNVVGNSVTLTSKALVAPGTYSARLYARAATSRALFDLTINGVKVATNLNTHVSGANSSNGGYNYPFDLTEGTVTFTEPTKLVLYFVITDVSKASHVYLNSIELTKVTEDDGEEEESSSTTTTTTTTTTTVPAIPDYLDGSYTIEDVANPDCWTVGQYKTDGTFNPTSTARASVKKLIQVVAGTTYILDAEGADLKYVVREYDADKKYIGTTNSMLFGAKYVPSEGTAFIGLVMFDGSPYADIVAGVIKPSMVEYVEPTTTTTTTVPVPVEQDGPTTDIVSTVDGAAIRLNEVNGMRFYANFKGNLDEVKEIGIIIAPKDIVGDYFTMEDDHQKVVYDHKTYGLWEDDQFVGSIVGIRETNANGEGTGNLARDFIARAYVVIGETTYYAKETTVRNLAAIADEYIADEKGGYAELNADIKEMVDLWAKAND